MRKKLFVKVIITIIFIFSCFNLIESNVIAQSEQLQSLASSEKEELESNKYIIDDTENIIYRVIPETEVEKFKNGFNIPDKIKIYENKDCQKEITSGYIGTGMALKNLISGKIYEISVIGDFNSDGKITQIELTQLIRHVVGLSQYQLSGSKLKSADFNLDNKINHIDITILIRYEVYGELEIKENKEIESPNIEIVSGTEGTNGWYTSEVKFKVLANEADSSKIEKNTYKISGTKEVKETEITESDIVTLPKGIYQITAYSYTKTGFKSLSTRKTIKIDDTIPDAPTIEVIGGTQAKNSEWYINDVTLKVTQAQILEPLSPINKITYRIEGASQTAETEIANEGTIQITEDGISRISVYNYNEAGTCSKAATIVIKKDSTQPNKAVVTVKDVKPTEYTLVGEADDEASGIATYEFYLDGKLYSTINSADKKVEVLVQNQTSEIHTAYIIVKDTVGHIKQSDNIEVQPAKLTLNEIDYFEFIVTDFTLRDNNGQLVQDGAESTISDTSLTSNAKYVMINATEQDIKGTVEGKLRLVRKDGTVVEKFEYFPEDLSINMSYYANGSGSTFSHEKEAMFFGTNLNSENEADGTNVSTAIKITEDNIAKNKFSIIEKKQSGTQTYIRATIQSLELGEEKLLFRITQE